MACGKSDYDNAEKGDVGALAKVVGCLKAEIGSLSHDMNRVNSSTSQWVSKIGEGDGLFKSIHNSFANSIKSSKEFATNLNEQYKYSENIAKSVKQASVNIGIGHQNQKEFGREFSKSLQLVQRYGGDLDDVKSIYTKFADESGRVRILQDDEVERIFQIEKATGLMGDSAAALAERFDLMGVGSEEFANSINDVVKDSQKIGLNSSKVVKVLSDNFKNMQNYSFRGGVKSMTEMSKLAVKMRMDVGEMLGMADKFYQPEAAIDAAANLQMLGGDVAAAFGDPIQMMYEARNAPEELAKRVGEVTSKMMTFNKETGEFGMTAEQKMQIDSMAESLGMNKAALVDTARQMSKIKQIKMDVGGNLFEEETMDKIASIAKFDKKSGQWSVDVDGEMKSLEELKNTPELLEKALKAPSTQEDAVMETAKASMTTNELLVAQNEMFKTGLVIKTDVYNQLEKTINPQIEKLMSTTNSLINDTSEIIKNSESFKDFSNLGGSISDLTTTLTGGFLDSIKETIGGLKDSIKEVKTDEIIADVLKVKKTESNGNNQKPDEIPVPVPDILSTPGGNRVITGDFGSFSLDNRDLFIAGKPQNLLGGNSNPNNIKIDPMTITINGDLSVNMPDGVTEKINVDSIKPQIIKLITEALNNSMYSGGKAGSTINSSMM